MAYIDSANIKGTLYELQDTQARTDIGDLKSAVTQDFEQGKNPLRFTWKQGQIAGDGVTINSTTSTDHCYSENYVGGFADDTTVYIKLTPNNTTNLAFNARVYDSNKTWEKNVSSMFGIVTFEAGKYYRFNVVYTGGTVSPSTADSFVTAYVKNSITKNSDAIDLLESSVSKVDSIGFPTEYKQLENVVKQDSKGWNNSKYVLLVDNSNLSAIEFNVLPETSYDVCGIGIGTDSAHAIQFWDDDVNRIGIITNATQESVSGESYHTKFDTPAGCVKVRYNQAKNNSYNSQRVKKYKPFSDAVEDSKYSIPAYYFADNYLNSKVKAIEEKMPLDGAVFAFVTDLHFKSNQGHSLGLLKYIRDKNTIHTIISGGDYVEAYGNSEVIDDSITSLLKYASNLYPDWFSLRGNHDLTVKTDANTASGATYSDAVCYNTIIRPQAEWRYDVPIPETSFYNSEHGINANYNWVLTNEQQKVKIIGFCDFNATNTEIYWGTTGYITNAYCKYLAQLLLACDGYTVIIATHAPLTSSLSGGSNTNLIKVVKAFANKTSVTQGAYTFDFTSSTGILACCISGHSHKDQSITEDGVLHINTTSDATYNNDPNTQRTAGAITEQAFDVFCIDTTARTIKTVRIGGGSDREFSY